MRVWLVRHGESLGNVHRSAWSQIPDHAIPLTEFGVDQAYHAGEKIRKYYEDNAHLKDKKVRLWYSPFLRTEQTKASLAKGLGEGLIENRNAKKEPGWEDDRLIEQDFGMFSPIHSREEQFEEYPIEAKRFYKIMEGKDKKGKYWAKAPGGENRSNVCVRTGDFIRTMMDDVREGQEDAVVVTHGVTMRAFEKRFMHRDIDWFESEPNPDNCDVVLIEGDKKQGYKVTKMFKGLERQKSLPPDHKTDPVGGWDILKEFWDFVKPALGRG